ncbi:MAG: chitobiase/beta-hexosaminidase C-terminal domain-containing protein [Candidatus Cloacimonetes bacterium]|nr:chitobiase/beta-hexosaminidase C-terminal domain-containing protein [Candidatus Cloacimonadota bacterium]
MQRYKYLSIILILTLLLFVLSSCSKKTTEPDVKTVATPTFNLASGAYANAQRVSISCATYGATIRYTTDGNDPTLSSAVYNSAITISSSATLKAKATKSGWTDSSIASAIYTISAPHTVASPTFNPPGGSYASAQSVSIICATDGATIRYTTDGNDPTPSSAIFSSPIVISSNATIKAIAYMEGWTPSPISSASYAITLNQSVAIPTFNPPGGSYANPQSVSITCATAGATIHYSTDGNDPTPSSAVYSRPISVSSSSTIKAIGYKLGWNPSPVSSANYAIEQTPAGFVYVPGGTYHDGSSNITVNGFYLDKYQITQADYESVMGTWNSDPNGDGTAGIGSNYPVYYVSWFNAIEYCNRRSLQEGLVPCYSYSASDSTFGTNIDNWPSGWNVANSNHSNVRCVWTANGYRLPRETEWEYAARGGSQTHGYIYSGSNDPNAVAWHWDNWGNAQRSTHTVGAKLANELGLFDMSGNVWEWCWDMYGGSNRVFRGGSWNHLPHRCTVSYQNSDLAKTKYSYVGFRVSRGSL